MALDMTTLLTQLEAATTQEEASLINFKIKGLIDSLRQEDMELDRSYRNKDMALRSIMTLSQIPAGSLTDTERSNMLASLKTEAGIS